MASPLTVYVRTGTNLELDMIVSFITYNNNKERKREVTQAVVNDNISQKRSQ